MLAVNAGSNEVSSLAASSQGLTLLSKVASGGTFPNSVALVGNLVYVLNAGGTPNVSGFRLSPAGILQPIVGSTRPLPGGRAAVAHDIRFSPDGSHLLVTEDGTNQIDVFSLGNDGLIASVTTTKSSGPGPFGMLFGRNGVLLVTEAAAAAVSSYAITAQAAATPIDASVPNGQIASCWISMTRNGHSFISNTASATLSSYQTTPSGQVNLVQAVATTTGAGSAPIDSALSDDDAFLYVVDSARGGVLIFAVNGNNLTSLGGITGLPLTVQGIAAQ